MLIHLVLPTLDNTEKIKNMTDIFSVNCNYDYIKVIQNLYLNNFIPKWMHNIHTKGTCIQ